MPISKGGGANGGGGSSPKDLGVVTTAALAVSGKRTLYTTGTGEFISTLRFGDAVIPANLANIIFEIAGFNLVTSADAVYGQLAAGASVDVSDPAATGIKLKTYFNAGVDAVSFRSPPLVAGALTATLSLIANGSFVGTTPGWQANHAYAGTAAIIAAGHYWDNGGAGMSGGSAPNFAGNLGGSVVDGTVTWFDEGAPTTGSIHAYIEVVTPAAP